MTLDDLPEFNELDVEFSKHSKMLYDIMASNFNKRIELLEILLDDLYEFTNKNLEQPQMKITKNVSFESAFPKKVRNESAIYDFSDADDIFFYSFLYISEKNKKDGFVVQFSFTIDSFYWLSGQYDDYEKGYEYFNYKFYKGLKEKIDKEDDTKLETSIFFPNTVKEDEDCKENKYIKLSIKPEIVDNKKAILKYHNLFKNMVLIPMFRHLNK